jgi:hypothetical protein
MKALVSGRRLATLCVLALVSLGVGVGAGQAAPSSGQRQAYPSFFASISTAFYYSYSGSISVSTHASFRDYQCYPSYDCDQNVIVQLELRNGLGPSAVLSDARPGRRDSTAQACTRPSACRRAVTSPGAVL